MAALVEAVSVTLLQSGLLSSTPAAQLLTRDPPSSPRLEFLFNSLLFLLLHVFPFLGFLSHFGEAQRSLGSSERWLGYKFLES